VDYPDGELVKFWPADVHLIGKDICWFHTVIWPCMLMSTDIPLPKQVISHGFVNGEDGRKMSKTYGNVVDPMKVLEIYNSDLVRYFCLREGVFGDDFSYSEQSLITRNDSELADDIGNLVRRSFNLAEQWNNGKVPNEGYDELFSYAELFNKVEELMSQFKIQQAYEAVLNCVKITNKYLADMAPWNLKEHQMPLKLKCVRTALEALFILGHFYLPLIPNAMTTLFNNFALSPMTLSKIKGWGNLKPGSPLNCNKQLLFPKIRENRFEKKKKQQILKDKQQLEKKEKITIKRLFFEITCIPI
jgi:methionyl-tRNA synthetase